MKPEDRLLSREEITAKYPKGSPDYPTHAEHCGCSGCYASWTEWRGGQPIAKELRQAQDRIAVLERALERARLLLERWLAGVDWRDHTNTAIVNDTRAVLEIVEGP